MEDLDDRLIEDLRVSLRELLISPAVVVRLECGYIYGSPIGNSARYKCC
jgi:hypothetical protein